MTAGDKQETMEKAVGYLESEQATSASPGNCTQYIIETICAFSRSERRSAPQFTINGLLCSAQQINTVGSSGDSHHRTATPNDSWDLEFPGLIFSYYITPQPGNLLPHRPYLHRHDYVRVLSRWFVKAKLWGVKIRLSP